MHRNIFQRFQIFQSWAQKFPSVLLWVFIASSSGFTYANSPANTVSNATELLEKYTSLSVQLAQNSYGRPLFLESSESATSVSGNAYAVLDSTFNSASATFLSPNDWCEVLILPINTKYCRANLEKNPAVLKVNIGKKTMQELGNTYAFEFKFEVESSSPNFLSVHLNAAKGPLGTTNYRIELQALPLPQGKTFIKLHYSYGYGFAGRVAMQGYLATIGSGKVGFTQAIQGDKESAVKGMRGAVERNTMRYYLAIDAYLTSLRLPAAQQFNSRLENWFNATEKYPDQFQDIDKDSYLVMKKIEYRRQKTDVSN